MALTFDEAAHVYRWNGIVVPNVTRILDPITGFSRIEPERLRYAQDLGTAVHKACELDDLRDLDEERLADVVRPYLAGYRKFKAECKPSWRRIESKVFHRLHQFAGTLDREGMLCGSDAIVDLKSGIEHPAVALQESAYLEALCSETGDSTRPYKRFALYLKDDGHYKLREIDRESHHHTDFRDFLCALGTYRWQQRNNLIN